MGVKRWSFKWFYCNLLHDVWNGCRVYSRKVGDADYKVWPPNFSCICLFRPSHGLPTRQTHILTGIVNAVNHVSPTFVDLFFADSQYHSKSIIPLPHVRDFMFLESKSPWPGLVKPYCLALVRRITHSLIHTDRQGIVFFFFCFFL
jgi:hypothetical protein